MDNISDCLKRIGNLFFGNAYLYRQTSYGLELIKPENDVLDYLKPNIGFSSAIEEYIILTKHGSRVTSFGLFEFPSCCAICVSTRAYVEPPYRKLGINKIANELRQAIASVTGYSALICTDVDENLAERNTLIANGFKDIYTLKNKRTGNVVNISIKEL